MPRRKKSDAVNDRVVGHGLVKLKDLISNPDNFRVHKEIQKEIVLESLENIGMVRRVLVNRRTNLIVDGHLRVTLAIQKSGGDMDREIPVDFLDLTEDEEQAVLLLLDDSTNMVHIDLSMRNDLLRLLSENTSSRLSSTVDKLRKLLDYRSEGYERNLITYDNVPQSEGVSLQPGYNEQSDNAKLTLSLPAALHGDVYVILNDAKSYYGCGTILGALRRMVEDVTEKSG